MSKLNKAVTCCISASFATGRKTQHSKTPTAFLPLDVANISHFPCDLRLVFERAPEEKAGLQILFNEHFYHIRSLALRP